MNWIQEKNKMFWCRRWWPKSIQTFRSQLSQFHFVVLTLCSEIHWATRGIVVESSFFCILFHTWFSMSCKVRVFWNPLLCFRFFFPGVALIEWLQTRVNAWTNQRAIRFGLGRIDDYEQLCLTIQGTEQVFLFSSWEFFALSAVYVVYKFIGMNSASTILKSYCSPAKIPKELI